MKNNITFLSFLILAIFFVSMSSHPHKNSGQAPTGKTGAPGETTCSDCHSGGSFDGQIDFLMGENTTTYTPGETYVITFTSSYNSPRHGFSLTALDAENNQMGDLVVLNDDNTSFASANDRQYIGHKSANDNNTWEFNWTAPETDAGTVTFYYVINAADNNGSTSGDMIATGSTSVEPASVQMYSLAVDINPENAGTVTGDGDYEEGETVALQATPNEGFSFVNWTDGDTEISIEESFSYTMPSENKTLTANFEEVVADVSEIQSNLAISLYPNPSSHQITLKSELLIYQTEIFDITGKRVLLLPDLEQKSINIPVSELQSGSYLVRVVSESGIHTRRFVKEQ
jgi:hypothetical protein